MKLYQYAKINVFAGELTELYGYILLCRKKILFLILIIFILKLTYFPIINTTIDFIIVLLKREK